MSSRPDWDKLRRQQRAAKPERYRSSDQWVSSHRLTKRRKRRANKRPAAPKPDITKLLRIQRRTFVAISVWRRTAGKWRCVKAAPDILWFTRVNHPNIIEQWLRQEHYIFQWLPATPACVAKLQAEGLPAEAYPLNQASQPSGVNTDPSLKKDTHAAQRDPGNPAQQTGNPAPATSCPAQTGVNPSPRCLNHPETCQAATP